MTVAPADRGEYERIRFCLTPPSITPNDLLPRHVIETPHPISLPSREDILSAEPASTVSQNITGMVLVGCSVAVDGSVNSCRIVSEDPKGYGLGQAALSLSSKIRATPETVDGVPQTSWFAVPIYFGSGPIPPPPRMAAQSPDALCQQGRGGS